MLINVNEPMIEALRLFLAQCDAQTGAGLTASAPVACSQISTVRAKKLKRKVKDEEIVAEMAKYLGPAFSTFLT